MDEWPIRAGQAPPTIAKKQGWEAGADAPRVRLWEEEADEGEGEAAEEAVVGVDEALTEG